MVAFYLRLSALPFLFHCARIRGYWLRRAEVPMGRKRELRLRRCYPSLLRRVKRDYEMKIEIISACIFVCQPSINIHRYGLLCGCFMQFRNYLNPVCFMPSTSCQEAHRHMNIAQSSHMRLRGGGFNDFRSILL